MCPLTFSQCEMIVKSTREYLFVFQKHFVLSTPSTQQVDDTPYTLCDDTIGDATPLLTAFPTVERSHPWETLGNVTMSKKQEQIVLERSARLNLDP